jgi:hypothetical protein
MAAEALLADKAFDADERVIEPLRARGKSFVIPPKSNRTVQRDFDRDAYEALWIGALFDRPIGVQG